MIDKIMSYLKKDRPRGEVRRLAADADRWLHDETLNTALAMMRAKAHDTWAASHDETVQRESWRMLQAIDLFVIDLRRLIAADTLKAHEEKHRETKLKRAHLNTNTPRE